MALLAGGELVVVETDEEMLLGLAEVAGDLIVVRNGFRGHPRAVPVADVVRVTLAVEHEDFDHDFAEQQVSHPSVAQALRAADEFDHAREGDTLVLDLTLDRPAARPATEEETGALLAVAD